MILLLNLPEAVTDRLPAGDYQICPPENFRVSSAGKFLIRGRFIPEEIAAFRLKWGEEDPYIYCYRPAVNSFAGASESVRVGLEELEKLSRRGDAGFPVPGNSAGEWLQNIEEDIHHLEELGPPSPEFELRYRRTTTDLAEIFPSARFHHIGSTALGIRCKPIIDILMSLPPGHDFRDCIPGLHVAGFYFVDYPENRKRHFFRYGFPRQMHVHLVEQDSAEEKNHLEFRDRLLSDPVLLKEYEKIKIESHEKFRTDRVAYGRHKGEFIDRTAGRLP